MKTYLMALGFDILESIVTVYTSPTTPPTSVVRKKENENNEKSMNAILCGLLESEFVKVMHCISTK
jgi:hypothetical protein